MTDHTINENETDNIMGKKENENLEDLFAEVEQLIACLLYTSPSPRDA